MMRLRFTAPGAASFLLGASAALAQSDVPREAFFGDTHVHTGWSADAGMDGAVKSPDEAYRFARGEKVMSNAGLAAQSSRPYDWFMVTDHSDGMGVINELVDGNEEMLADEVLKGWSDARASGDEKRMEAAKSELVVMQSQGRLPSIVMDPKWMKSAWEKTIAAAEAHYRPGEFTTFIAYEWTVNADGGDNLHRNVIFRGTGDQALQVLPLTIGLTPRTRRNCGIGWQLRRPGPAIGFMPFLTTATCPMAACSKRVASTGPP